MGRNSAKQRRGPNAGVQGDGADEEGMCEGVC
jgi:hypothetical protein